VWIRKQPDQLETAVGCALSENSRGIIEIEFTPALRAAPGA
jgi:hypothetical protein